MELRPRLNVLGHDTDPLCRHLWNFIHSKYLDAGSTKRLTQKIIARNLCIVTAFAWRHYFLLQKLVICIRWGRWFAVDSRWFKR